MSTRYSPTRLWGYSGHIQTILQGVISRLHCPLVDDRRQSFTAPDGATVTYDIYQPIEEHPTGGESFKLSRSAFFDCEIGIPFTSDTTQQNT